MTSKKNFLFSLIGIFFVFTTVKFYSFYVEYSSWQYSDWLINYQGGFVRRGLIGEILFQIHKILSIDLDLLIFFFVIFLYLVLSIILIQSLKYLSNSYLDSIIMLSPGFFLYPIMNSEVTGRKEILLLSIFFSLIFFDKKIHKNLLFPIFLISIITLCLSHSAFVFFMPYFLIAYVLIKFNTEQKLKIFEFIIFVFTIFVLVFLIYNFQGTQLHVVKICESVKNFTTAGCGTSDQISWIANSVQDYFFEKKERIYKYLLIYFPSLIMVFLFIFIRLINSQYGNKFQKFNRFHPFLAIVFLFLCTIPVYILGLDWGRYIHISYSLTIFLYIYCLKNNVLFFKESQFLNKIRIKKIFIFIFIFFYSFSWTFPFYNAINFKLTLEKPFKKLIKKIN